ncbi:MAG: hypothetical protein ABIO71_14150 [Caldimonas sp.]
MRLGDGIRKIGFRKWYARELTRGHLGLLLLILSAIGGLGTLEIVTRRAPLDDRLGGFALLLVCAGIGVWALRRYVFLLMRAEHAARQATCRQCQTYGILDLVRSEPQLERLKVCCRKCRHAWSMSDFADD